MKVLFITPSFYPSIGGVEKHVLEVSRELIKKDLEISIITEKPDSNYHSSLNSDNEVKQSNRLDKSTKTKHDFLKKIKVQRFDFGKAGKLKKFKIWWILFKHRSLFADADVIHCHDVFIWYLPFRFLYPHKKVFTTFHGYEGKYPISQKAKLIRKVSEKLSHGNICIGKFIEKWYGTKADEISYGGVRTKQISWPKAEKVKLQSSKFRILFIGRISKDTGVFVYSQILEQLKKENISFEFSAIGDGELKEEFGKFGKVKGFVSNVDSYIQRADVIFASSYLSILESLIQKKLVIAVFTNPLKKDYLEMTPFKNNIVISDDVDVIVDTIKKDKSNIKIQEGYEWATKQTWEKLADQYITLWKN